MIRTLSYNVRIMHAIYPLSRLHLLIPFSLPTLANEHHVFQNLNKPALNSLIERATLVERVVGNDIQRSLPHEKWVASCFDISHAPTTSKLVQILGNAVSNRLEDPTAADIDVPIAPYMLLADGGEPRDAVWMCVEPIHLQVTQTHLLLSDPNILQLSTDNAIELLSVARPLIEELGIELEAPTPLRWYLSGEQLGLLASATPLQAARHNIENWLSNETYTSHWPRTWIKLQNEVQMAWFNHPVNQAREECGLLSVNSIWPYAQGRIMPVTRPFEYVLSRSAAIRGLALASAAALGVPPVSFDMLPQQSSLAPTCDPSGVVLVELDQLSAPFLQQDWLRFRTVFAVMEHDWFAPALAALKRYELSELTLTLCGDTIATTLAIRPIEMKKFWRRRAFTSLLL
ncbi:regulator [Candidatus Vallotiella sp. (ex Adelges kitamiensis)]|uniref:regulator n=1 Tax=Candidatus Vallotiella sp. (ex Adelges kitamiensis) TaxID=2864217 RepID=UPI001CE2533C|nr:regulator [Candidatus Vallotia sp. (ex Adelges kitamiensis)]